MDMILSLEILLSLEIGEIVLYFRAGCLFPTTTTKGRGKPITEAERMKTYSTQRGTQSPQSKATKTLSAINVLGKERKEKKRLSTDSTCRLPTIPTWKDYRA